MLNLNSVYKINDIVVKPIPAYGLKDLKRTRDYILIDARTKTTQDI